MEAYRSHKNRYLALAALALLFAVAFVTVSTASESDAATTVILAPGEGSMTLNGEPSSNYYSGTTTGGNGNSTFTIPTDNTPDDRTSFTIKKSDNEIYVYHKDGYSFTGWKRAGGQTLYQSGQRVNINSNPTTLTAQWDINEVTFNPNGGNCNYYYKADVSKLTVPENEFDSGGYHYSYTRTGYIFLGWSTEKNATFAQYLPGNTLPVPDRDYTLYAVWKKEITITYQENGGSVSPSQYSFQTYEDQIVMGSTFTVNGTEYNYTREGYTFLGWSTTSGASVAQYVYGDYLATGESNITLYAIWSSGCKIVFDPNGGSANRVYSPTIAAALYVPGSSFTVDDVEYTYTNSGYSFLGWSRDRNSDTPEFVEGSLLQKTTTGYIIYAIWSPEASKIIFDYGDGVTAEVYVDYGYTFDSSSYMSYTPADKGGYKIVGWTTIKMSDTKDGGDAYSLPAGAETYSRKITFNTITNLTLHPIWAKIMEKPSSGALTFTSDNTGCYYVGNSAAVNGIVANGGSPYIFLDGVSVDFTPAGGSPFVLQNGASVNLTVMSDCYFKGQDNALSGRYFIGYAGINVQSGTTFTLNKNSLGKLTAEGGNASSYYYYPDNNSRNEIGGRAGAGIGANGYAANTPYDSGCGYIIINGGNVCAYGGDGLVDYRYYVNENNSRIISNYVNFDIVAAQGIGGTTSSNTIYISINGGTVTAATGHINGFTANKNNWQVDSTSSKYIDPIYDGTQKTSAGYGSRTYISPNAIVTMTSDSDVDVIGDYDILYFTSVKNSDGSQCTIGSALSVTIDGTVTIDLGGASITQYTELKIPAGKVSNGSTITLVTSFYSYFTGSVTKSGSRYNVTLTEPTAEAHGTVNVYVNEQSVGIGEAFGSLTPNQAFTIRSSQSATTSMTYPFTLNLNTGYQYVGVKIGTVGTGNVIIWEDHELTDGESVTTANNIITCILKLGLSTEGAGTANYISFTIKKTTVEVTLKNTYSEGAINFLKKTLTTGTTDPSSLSWNDETPNEYTVGTQYVYYKDSLTCTIDVTRGDEDNPLSVNPFIVKWITVNDVPLTPTYDQEHNNGKYTFTVTDISEDTVIEIRYGPTVKLSGYVTFPAGTAYTYKDRINVLGINADGTDGFLKTDGTVIDPEDHSKTYVSWDVYVGKGSAAYFKVYSSGSWDSDPNGKELGISRITASSIGSRDRSIYPNVENVYSLGTLYADTTINVLLTEIKWDLIFTSIVGDQTKEYKVSVVDGTFYEIPGLDMFETLGLPSKAGYDLASWDIVKWSNNNSASSDNPPTNLGTSSCTPGTNMQITCKMVFTTVWSTDPHEYTISYSNYDGSEFDATGITETYTVETETFTLGNPVRGGYDFKGWLTDEEIEDIASGVVDFDPETYTYKAVTITKGTTGDLHYTAVWIGKLVTFTLTDRLRPEVNVTQQFRVGDPFTNLPIYSNRVDTTDSKLYSFAGWSLNKDYTHRITDSDRVPYYDQNVTAPTPNEIYVIWVDSNLYIINILPTTGGTVTVGLIYGEPGQDIVFTLTANSGYKVKGITINGTTTTFEDVSNPYTYTLQTSSSSLINYYSVKGVFEKLNGVRIPYPDYQEFVYDGTEHTAVVQGTGYTITGDNTETNAGTYHLIITLETGYIWMNYSTDDYPIDWDIKPRTAFIIAESDVKKLSEISEGWPVSNNGYVTLFVLEDDKAELNISNYVGSEASPASSITAAGLYENQISYTPSGNYDIIVIHGTYIVYRDVDSSTVVYSMIDTSSAANAGTDTREEEETTEPTGSNVLSAIRLSSNVQSAVRRGKV